MREKTISTLPELLKEYKVVVPIIQRDYAQGRIGEHVNRVRSKLLEDMKKAILGEKQLDLNFVYGKEEEKKFIPIDGQQRLTTLFLLHLYAFKEDRNKTEILHKFTYETRISSKEFFGELVNHRTEIFSSKLKPSEEIKDAEWFLANWENDPTIKSVLVMLDNINSQFCDVENLEELLIDEERKPIIFKFLNIEDLGTEDSLYIKLNARGKPLTDFENFKAQLINRIKKLELSFADEFERKFDTDWTDFFWSEYKENFDETYLTFFKVLFMNNELIYSDETYFLNIDYEKINEEILKVAFYLLNYLYENLENKDNEIVKLVKNILAENRTYRDRIIFHAISGYMLKNDGKVESTFDGWIRIIKNLVFNSQIDAGDLYRRAIYSINELLDNCNEITKYFADRRDVRAFNKLQVEEEQAKAKIILENEEFAKEIYEAEKHLYFKGQIRSALYLSRIEGKYDKETFVKYWKKISELFNDKKSIYGNLLRRAMLTFGDYTLEVSQFKTLCVDDSEEGASTSSMKALFSKVGEITTKLLDRIDINRDIEKQLNEIIEKSDVSKDDWRYCFIKYPKLFNLMSDQYLRIRYFYYPVEAMHIIKRQYANGINYNIFLMALKLELQNRNIYSYHDEEIRGSGIHWLSVKGLEVIFKNKQFFVRDENGDRIFETISDDLIKEVADFIEKY